MKANYSIGLRFGLITGLIYAMLLFLRYRFFAGSPGSFGGFMLMAYLVILVLYFLAGRERRKQQGGTAEFREIFQTILLTIFITELFYVVFNFIYLKYIEPSFFTRFESNTRHFLETQRLSPETVNEEMDKYKDLFSSLGPVNVLKGFAVWIIMDSIIGLIYSVILRKKKNNFENPQTV